MRLKSLEVVGFKSFAERTIVEFEEGVTGIVGPNGCGKSNVVDAIRWVMGEQSAKHLRGSSMGDVIFNGTETRPSMGMASVFLTFDNSDGRAPAEYADYTEITVGRRLYRSGESEYYINKAPCRLKDIVDLFLGTGIGAKAYAIVEQGMIGQVLSAKPEDRRVLIEEAAGISKFKARKEAAVRKMESTKANLERLTDVLNELQRQMNSLYRQAKKAERFKRFSDELKDLELTVSAHQYRNIKESVDALKSKLDNTKENEVSDGSKLSIEESEIEQSKVELNELEIELDLVQETLYQRQNELQLTEADINYQTKEIENINTQSEKWAEEIEDFQRKIGVWRTELSESNKGKVEADLKVNTAKDGLAEIEDKLQDLRDDHHQLVIELEDSRKRLVGCIESVSKNSSNLDQFERRDAEIDSRIAKDQAEIDEVDSKIKELEEKIGEGSSVLTGTKQLKLSMEEESSAAYETLERQKEEQKRLETKINYLKDELSQKRSRLFSLDELSKNFEGYQEGVKNVLKKSKEEGEMHGVVGTINEVVETKPEYETAVGAVLGEKLQYVVVESHTAGVEAIDYLKTQATGRSTFVPMELRSESMRAASIEGEGVLGPLANYVNYTDNYKKIVNYLFNDVVLVEDLNKALKVWADNDCAATFVTMDGEVVDPAGIVTGGIGGDGSQQLMEHRREMKELTEAVSKLTSELKIEEQQFEKVKERVKGIQKNIEDLEKNSHEEEIRLVHQEKEVHHAEQQLSYYTNQRDKLTVEIAALMEEKEGLRSEEECARSEYDSSSSQKSQFEAEVDEKQQAENELRNRLQDMTQKKTEYDLQVETEKDKALAFERDVQRLINSIVEAEVGIAVRKGDISESVQTVKTVDFSIKCKREHLSYIVKLINDLKSKHVEIKSKYDELANSLREKEALIRELRKYHDEHVQSLHEIELDLTTKQEKINYMSREIFDKYRVALESSYQEYISEEIELESSAERVDELKTKLDKIGSVNVDAIHEYEELKVRNDFLQGQFDDLSTSMNDLHRAIQKINKTSKVRFQEAFDSVNERFQKMFPKLFEGGKARLVLTEEQNVLESGVDIIAQPPGKKLQSVTLLSGGEKALTAVALIFSIFLHRPSPFCLLDEVDAPLDDANIDRFNEMIREMTKISQFILITHNKRTMELADTLYGVTMEERGASKVISISLTDKKSGVAAA